MDEEEYPKVSRITFSRQYLSTWEEYSYVPFEMDGEDYLGYKVLVTAPESPYLLSPNHHIFGAVWRDGQLSSDQIPTPHNENGIYATKSVETLKGWYKEYERQVRLSFYHSSLVVVQIIAYPQIVEHQLGFRCQHAKIRSTINGHW